MSIYLGIDTSNYTTSVAFYNTENNMVRSCKKLLPVNDGTLGLRQSDAVFAHVKQLGLIVDELLEGNNEPIKAVSVSTKPRDAESSYMPCFLTGLMAAQCLSASHKVPLYTFSHQAGHIEAALYSAGKMELAGQEFIAFHFSGGTTDCLHVRPGEGKPFEITEISTSSDLKAGQAVDRVGGMLNLGFPAGPKLDLLAAKSRAKFKHKPAFKGLNPCLSGIENKCRKMLDSGETPEDVARCCIEYICAVADRMTSDALSLYPKLPVIYAGGVMCNSIIRLHLSEKYDGSFAAPEFSSDNACGIALLGARKEGAV